MKPNEQDEIESGANRLNGRLRSPGDAHDGHTKMRTVQAGEVPPRVAPSAGGERQLPPVGPERSGSSKVLLWIGGGLIALGVLAVILVGGGLVLAYALGSSGSTQDDEVRSAQKEQADFKMWKGYVAALQTQGRNSVNLGLPQAESKGAFGWWQRKTVLPHEGAVRSALMRRLPANYRLIGVQPVRLEKADEGVAVAYQVTLKCTSAECLVPVDKVKLSSSVPKGSETWLRYLVMGTDLPPGKMFLADEKTILLRDGETVQFAWTVRQAAKADGTWRVLDAEPLPFQRNTGFEYRLVEMTPGVNAAFLRSTEELNLLAAQQDKRLQEFRERFERMNEQIAAYRAERMASVPGVPKKDNTKFGGSGSGEPTKTAARVGGGAATGAAIGAMAGGGEGAGWGALGGLVAGGVYDAVSKSNDKKKFEEAKQQAYEERKANRSSALRAAERDIAAYEKKLRTDYESELKEEAKRQESKLRSAAGI